MEVGQVVTIRGSPQYGRLPVAERRPGEEASPPIPQRPFRALPGPPHDGRCAMGESTLAG
eukprot:5218074-Alexandrium_andersonii.AAC.1